MVQRPHLVPADREPPHVEELDLGQRASVRPREDVERRRALRKYGLDLGLAFQLVDDALDYSGDSDELGKNPGDDFREGKATLPLLLAIARTGPAEREFWLRTVDRLEQTDADFERARELMRQTGALEATLDLARAYADSAKAALADFPATGWRPALQDLADFAVARRA